jgi:U4/U6 small nuclear ribonucleoprotein PRP31
MSLADVLKADLDDLEDLEDDQINSSNHNDEIEDVTMAEEMTENEIYKSQAILTNYAATTDSVRNIAKLIDSDQLKTITTKIENYRVNPRNTVIIGSVEQDDEYKLIVEANNLTVEIDNEINVVHKYIRDKYSKRFPELESLVPQAMDYIKGVLILGNRVEKAKNNEELLKFLTTATIMIVSVSASTTQGVDLNEKELDLINDACRVGIKLDDIKANIFEYVQSRMTFIAPNLSVIIGASTAAKLMGIAGGLTNLSKMPACNILLLGQQRKTLSGFSTVQIIPHTGYIYNSELVQRIPPDLRRKVSRVVAGKLTLAARIDSFHQSRDGNLGMKLKGEVEHRIEKLQEPPPVKQIKPLAPPIEQARKKRGGRRARKMKERLGITELRKQANRMTFGEIEEDAYQDDLSFSTGQVGKGGSGRIRAAQVDSKTKARISQKLQKTIQKQNQWGGTTSVRKHVSGTASSIAFTPLQGLEIVNPNAVEKEVKGTETQKYFSSAGFFKTPIIQPK